MQRSRAHFGTHLTFWTILIGAAVSAAACGGSSEAGPSDSGVIDASADPNQVSDGGSDSSKADAITDAAADACSVDVDLRTYDVADAAIGDSGANAARCAACTRQKCPSDIAACNESCECKVALVAFYDCFSQGGSLTSCASSFIGLSDDVRKIGQSFGLCAFSQCNSECGASSFFDGGELPDGALGDARGD